MHSTPEDIDLTGIARMEVIKGPASPYGSGLEEHQPYTLRAEVRVATPCCNSGSFNTFKAAAGGNMQRNNLQIGGQMSHLARRSPRNNRLHRTTPSSGSWRQPWSLT